MYHFILISCDILKKVKCQIQNGLENHYSIFIRYDSYYKHILIISCDSILFKMCMFYCYMKVFV